MPCSRTYSWVRVSVEVRVRVRVRVKVRVKVRVMRPAVRHTVMLGA